MEHQKRGGGVLLSEEDSDKSMIIPGNRMEKKRRKKQIQEIISGQVTESKTYLKVVSIQRTTISIENAWLPFKLINFDQHR